MKITYLMALMVSAFLFCGNISAQIKKDKALGNEDVISDPVGALLDSENFEFIANTMFPMGQPSKNLVGSDYSVSFSPKMILSDLPFSGVAHRGMGVGRDKGMRFQGKPMDFSIIHSEKEYHVTASVKTDDDSFDISMDVSKTGYATLTIESKNRESVSYQGEIRKQ